MRAAHLDDLGAQPDQHLEGVGEPRPHPDVVTVPGQLTDHADAHAAQVPAGGGGHHAGYRQLDTGRVQRVMARDGGMQQSGVGDRTGQRPGLVQRAGEGDETVAAHPAVGRLDPDQPAHGRGLADRAARVGADRDRGLESGHSGRAAAAAAAGDAVGVPRVAGRPVRGVLGGRPHRELVHVGLTDDHNAGGPQLRHHSRVVRRPPALKHPAAAGRRHAARGEHVLEGQRDARKRPETLPRGPAAVDTARRGDSTVDVDVQERVDPIIDLRDPVKRGLSHLQRAEFTGGDRGGGLGGGEAADVGHGQEPSLVHVKDARYPEPAVFGGGRAGKRVGLRQRRAGDVRSEHVRQRDGVGGRRDVARGNLRDPGDSTDDHVKLGGERTQLLVGQGQPRQAGKMRDLVPGNRHTGHTPPTSRDLTATSRLPDFRGCPPLGASPRAPVRRRPCLLTGG